MQAWIHEHVTEPIAVDQTVRWLVKIRRHALRHAKRVAARAVMSGQDNETIGQVFLAAFLDTMVRRAGPFAVLAARSPDEARHLMAHKGQVGEPKGGSMGGKPSDMKTVKSVATSKGCK